ncbi:MAG TPA: CmpA/NrtA family ABC transporter substrate-binding protein [Candidatus Binatia bacterium]|nr:CmpA/NrtA family ABC transporter substrate-binding protein [Candidatus Binatia bacterium]
MAATIMQWRTIAAAAWLSGLMTVTAAAAVHAADLEKEELTLGFIKLTDCAPIVIAKEKGFFDDEGLFVKVEPQANWKTLMDRVIDGQLDGSHMLAPAPLGHTEGLLTNAHIVVPYVMSENGAGISVSQEVWEMVKTKLPLQSDGRPVHPIGAEHLKPALEEFKNRGKPFRMAMTYPVGVHNYSLRYWLAAGGIHPGFYTPSDTNGVTDAEVQLSVTPPPQMPSVLEAGTVQGVCVNEPWHTQVSVRGIGVPVTSSYFYHRGLPDKVFGVTAAWAEKHPNTLRALVRALLRAGKWLDQSVANRDEAARILSKPEYVGADYEIISRMLTGKFGYGEEDIRDEPDWDVFFRGHATYPYYSGAVWWLTQVRRWGQIDAKPDQWYLDLARKVYRPDIWTAAAKELVAQGRMTEAEMPQTDGFKSHPASDFIDNIAYDGRRPNEYLQKFAIGMK